MISGSRRKLKKIPQPQAPLAPELAPDDRELAELGAVFADLTNRRQRAFLAGFVVAKGVNGAERLSGVARWSHYKWMRDDALYRERFKLVKEIIADDMEEEVFRRAFFGSDTPVVYRGEITAWYKTYSDALAIFALKAMKPEVYNRSSRPEFDFDGPCPLKITYEKADDARGDQPAASGVGARFIAPGSTPSEDGVKRAPSDYEQRALDMLKGKL